MLVLVLVRTRALSSLPKVSIVTIVVVAALVTAPRPTVLSLFLRLLPLAPLLGSARANCPN